MKNIMFLILLFWVSGSAGAQINSVISYEKGRGNPVEWPIVGKFEFEELPRPLTPTKVDFTLEAQLEQEQDWTIRLFYNERASKVLSDTIFNWPGPHKKGDQFTGIIEFIPLESGIWGMALGFPDEQYMYGRKNNVSYYWCIDEDGNLISLGKQWEVSSKKEEVLNTIFFKTDSLIIEQWPESRKNELFQWEIIINPTPRIGKVSHLRCHLKSNRNLPAQFKAKMTLRSIDITENPQKICTPISADQNLELEMDFIPKPVNDYHMINILFNTCKFPDLEPYCDQGIAIDFIFNEDSTLRYLSTKGFGLDYNEKLPKCFSPGNSDNKRLSTINLLGTRQ